MTLDDAPREALNRDALTRTEKFTVALFGVFTALIILPGLVFSAIAIISPGSIDLSH